MRVLFAIFLFLVCSNCFGQAESSKDSAKIEGLITNPQKSQAKWSWHCLNTLKKTSEPLYIINNKIADLKAVQDLDSNEIKSVTILNGEDAKAIYGISGANGAIIVQLRQKDFYSLMKDSVALFVLNGIPVVEHSELLKIDPADIESINILKDSEVQIGCRRFGSIILITTCRVKKLPAL